MGQGEIYSPEILRRARDIVEQGYQPTEIATNLIGEACDPMHPSAIYFSLGGAIRATTVLQSNETNQANAASLLRGVCILLFNKLPITMEMAGLIDKRIALALLDAACEASRSQKTIIALNALTGDVDDSVTEVASHLDRNRILQRLRSKYLDIIAPMSAVA